MIDGVVEDGEARGTKGRARGYRDGVVDVGWRRMEGGDGEEANDRKAGSDAVLTEGKGEVKEGEVDGVSDDGGGFEGGRTFI